MKKGAEQLKTRPDLDDQAWLVWLSRQPENRGILVAEMYRKMLEWCGEKRITPTRLPRIPLRMRTRQSSSAFSSQEKRLGLPWESVMVITPS